MNDDLPAIGLEDRVDEVIRIPDVLPVMALKDAVLFPFTIMPLAIGRERSRLAVDAALSDDRLILLVTQRDASAENPEPDALYGLGCVARVMRMLKLPDGTVRVLVQGLVRAEIDYYTSTEPHLEARARALAEPAGGVAAKDVEVFIRTVRQGLERASTLGKGISPEVMLIASNLEEPGRLADLTASNLGLRPDDAQRVLEAIELGARTRLVHELLARELELLEMQQQISSQVRGELDRGQREYFLRQQLRAIQRELGEVDDLQHELDEYRRKLGEAGLPDEAREEVETQIRRLDGMHPDSAETGVVRTWLDWMTSLPWSRTTADQTDLRAARTILDADHYDLDRVKQRVLEFLAVRTLKPTGKGPILCFVGPPGVGKTSLGRSIARALGREFVRTSLGGVRDEAEIRGHRRTYVGALPGRIIQSLHQAGSANPVFMLDEVDKVGADVRGDPSSALLEVLDPEQNSTFRDHYLGVPFDLSRVLFIATANVTETIQPAFLDRMEVIRLSGYSEEEKHTIAYRHLIPRQIEENGLTEHPLRFTDDAVLTLIGRYTQEAGLRQLERRIASVCRKVAVQVAEGRRPRRRITGAGVEKLLGPPEILPEPRPTEPRVGIATGLAYTAFGGDVLLVEAITLPGKAELKMTGSLGDVMKESASAALTVARSRAADWGLDPALFETHGLHVHVPAGAVPKDGPSAGVTILTAIVSVVSGRRIRNDLAMTGELTLRGDVLPVGGVKEKVLAALRAGIPEVLLPADNERDLVELPPKARKRIRIRTVRTVDDVLAAALVPDEEPPPPAPKRLRKKG